MYRIFWKVASLLTVLAVVAALFVPATAVASNGSQYMPPNPDKILNALIKRGAIPANATPAQKEAALQAYLKQKLATPEKGYNPLAKKQVEANEEALNQTGSNIRGRKLGNTTSVPASKPQYQPLEGTDKLLMILVDFADAPYSWTDAAGNQKVAQGPLHNQIPVPDNDFDLYVKNFDTQHYEDMMFTPGGWTFPADSPRYAGEHRGSMYDYYLEQSYGKYTVTGQAYGWFTVNKPEAYYGDDSPSGNDNMQPGATKDLMKDAVAVINSQNAINWLDYDTNNDCIIDHPLFIHAGVDQSGGGGAQGDDAIWAHSSSALVRVSTARNPGDTCYGGLPDGTYIYNYTIMPEDGGVGVFAHEFGHDLGLPDEYDTIYSGNGASTAFWSLMSSGSWLGKPAQTQPSDISIWGRYSLGWVDDKIAVVNLSDLTKATTNFRLEQAERFGGDGTINALRINLPPKEFYVNTPHSGAAEWFGGKGDEIDTTLDHTVDLTGKTTATLSFWTWYDIEENWDFGFVQVSDDGGATWHSLAMDGTVLDPNNPDIYPTIPENLPGFTGNSNGWQQKSVDLSAYAGKNITLRFRYITDWGTSLSGFYVDDVAVTADGAPVFTDTAENGENGWVANGWALDPGFGFKNHYYLMEWRNFAKMETPYEAATMVNFDAGLANVYQYDSVGSNPNQPKYFSYAPGLLVWYRDMTFTDNWTGVHPGGGFLLPVDANPKALLRVYNLPWNNRVQAYDTTFSLRKAPNITLSYANKLQTITGANAVPSFNDALNYWNAKAPDAGTIISKYGLLFRVLGQASDGSAAVIGLGLSK